MSQDPRDVNAIGPLAAYQRGHELLGTGDFEGAEQVALDLEKIGFTGAYEIHALALLGREDHAGAIAKLEEGVEIAPDAWPNWCLLGNLRCDAGNHAGARRAFDRAAACDGVDLESVALSRAVLATREAEFEAALEHLDAVTAAPLRGRVALSRVFALIKLGRLADAEAAAQTAFEDSNVDVEMCSAIAADLGRARLENGVAADEVRQFALGACRHFAPTAPLLWLVREIDAARAPGAEHWNVEVEVTFESPRDGHSGYAVRCGVIAATEEQLEPFVRDVLAPAAGDSLTLRTRVATGAQPDELAGVAWVAPRVMTSSEHEGA